MGRDNRVRSFESSIERLSRIISAQWKIRVVFAGQECFTDGNVIHLPVLPDSASQDLMDAVKGHLDHEVAHVKFTDFSSVKKLERSDRKLFLVTNHFEDPRIENKMVEVWPGCKTNLTFAREWTLNKIRTARTVPDPDNPGQFISERPWDQMNSFGKVLRATCIFLYAGGDENYWFLKEIVEPEIMEIVLKHKDISLKALAATNTGEVIEVAREYLKALNEEEDPIEEIDPNDIKPEDKIVPPGTSSPFDQLMKSKENKDGGRVIEPQLKEEKEPVPAQKKLTDVSDTDLGADSAKAESFINEEVKEATKAASGDYLVYTTATDSSDQVKDGNKREYKIILDEASMMVNTIRRRMTRSLLATNTARWEGDKTRGKINPRSLTQIALGTSKRVFRQRVESESYDTAVQIMIDHSGSMDGNKIQLAAQSAIVLGEVLNQLNIPFSILGFSTGTETVAYNRKTSRPVSEQQLFSRWGEHKIYNYKNFNELWATSNHKLTHMFERFGGINTYDAESLKYGAIRLLDRREKRKILFWMNDGAPQPNGSDKKENHIAYLKKVVTYVEKAVELIAIGIMTDSVKKYYKNNVVVNELNDLPKICLGKLDEFLRGGQNKFIANIRNK